MKQTPSIFCLVEVTVEEYCKKIRKKEYYKKQKKENEQKKRKREK
jgi:hypothetical protein